VPSPAEKNIIAPMKDSDHALLVLRTFETISRLDNPVRQTARNKQGIISNLLTHHISKSGLPPKVRHCAGKGERQRYSGVLYGSQAESSSRGGGTDTVPPNRKPELSRMPYSCDFTEEYAFEGGIRVSTRETKQDRCIYHKRSQ
jgi:hypothetical protein